MPSAADGVQQALQLCQHLVPQSVDAQTPVVRRNVWLIAAGPLLEEVRGPTMDLFMESQDLVTRWVLIQQGVPRTVQPLPKAALVVIQHGRNAMRIRCAIF